MLLVLVAPEVGLLGHVPVGGVVWVAATRGPANPAVEGVVVAGIRKARRRQRRHFRCSRRREAVGGVGGGRGRGVAVRGAVVLVGRDARTGVVR